MNNNYFFVFLAVCFMSCGSNNTSIGFTPLTEMSNAAFKAPGNTSAGTLSFKMNGELFEADATNAKAWALEQIPLMMLIAKNSKGMMVSMEVKNATSTGTFKIDKDSKGSVSFKLNGKDYWNRSIKGDNYMNVTIISIKKQGTILLMSGTFEGVLQDKNKNKVQITEGKFTTEKL